MDANKAAEENRSLHTGEMVAADREVAERFGYEPVRSLRTTLICKTNSRQVFKREFGHFSTFSFAFSGSASYRYPGS